MDQSTINCAAPSSPYQPLPTKPACSISAEDEFSDAARRWMESRSVKAMSGTRSVRYIRKNTAESYQQYIRSLDLFFAGHKLGDIRAGNLAAYQEARICGREPFIRYRRPQDAKDKMKGGVLTPAKGKTSCPVKPKKVNQELGLLQHIMKRASCWSDEIEELYQPLLDDENEVPRALSPEEQRHWLEVAASQTRWDVVYWYSILAFDTCMSTDEIRGLRLGDINTIQRVVTVARKTAKNGHRARTIELVGGDVLWAVERLLSVARYHGAMEPQHYLFPWRVKIGVYDPTRPMSESGIKVAWNEVRQQSCLKWFRQYDCRHTAITRLAEAGVPTDVIMSRSGHVSEKMRRHYTHISQASQRKWLEHSQHFHHVDRTVPAFQFPPREAYHLAHPR